MPIFDKSFIVMARTSKTTLGLILRSLRVEKGLTLHEVAKRTDIDSTMLSKIETAKRLPTDPQFESLCQFFGPELRVEQPRLIAERIVREYGTAVDAREALNIASDILATYHRKKS